MKTDEYWKLTASEGVMTEEDSQFWKSIEPLLRELFEELKRNGKIETVFTPLENRHLENIHLNRAAIIRNFNLLAVNTQTTERAKSFFNGIAQFGFKDYNIVQLLIEFSAYSAVIDIEFFKTLILSRLRDVDFKVSNFKTTMQKSAPIIWKRLKPLLYSDFRNALAHGTWTIENWKIVLFKDAKLIPFEELELRDFLIKTREQCVLCNCLLSVIQDLFEHDFFT